MSILVTLITLVVMLNLFFSKDFIDYYVSCLSFIALIALILNRYIENPEQLIILISVILNLAFILITYLNKNQIYKKKHIEENH